VCIQNSDVFISLNYGTTLSKVSHVIFEDCFILTFLFMKLILLLANLVELLGLWVFILLFMIRIGMNGVLQYWPSGHE
jgi:hypothetical protein